MDLLKLFFSRIPNFFQCKLLGLFSTPWQTAYRKSNKKGDRKILHFTLLSREMKFRVLSVLSVGNGDFLMGNKWRRSGAKFCSFLLLFHSSPLALTYFRRYDWSRIQAPSVTAYFERLFDIIALLMLTLQNQVSLCWKITNIVSFLTKNHLKE